MHAWLKDEDLDGFWQFILLRLGTVVWNSTWDGGYSIKAFKRSSLEGRRPTGRL